MKSTGRFFIVFFITCILISFLFYLVFRHPTKSLVTYPYLSKTETGLPGMDKKPMRQSKPTKPTSVNDDKLGKPLPPPKMPTPPVPLVVKVAPPGPPIEKPMMT